MAEVRIQFGGFVKYKAYFLRAQMMRFTINHASVRRAIPRGTSILDITLKENAESSKAIQLNSKVNSLKKALKSALKSFSSVRRIIAWQK